MEKKYIGRALSLCIALPLIFTGCSALPKKTEKREMQIKNVFLPMESKAEVVEFKLYFGTGDLKSVKADERSVKRDELLGYVLLSELIKGPAIKSELKPLLPQDTKVLNFSIRDDVGYVNLDGAAFKRLKVDKDQEKSIAACVVNTLCQLPSVNRIQFMFDNQKKDTLIESFDISEPLSPGSF